MPVVEQDALQAQVDVAQQLRETTVVAEGLRRLLAERNAELAEARLRLHNRAAEVAWLRAELQARNEACALLTESRSWRLTAPLRQIGRTQTPAEVVKALRLAMAPGTGAPPEPVSLEEMLRNLVPDHATLLVLTNPDQKPLQVNGINTRPFPACQPGVLARRELSDSTAAIAQLEALRAKGADFLLVPSREIWWLDYLSQFRRHLSEQYLLLLNDPTSGVVFNLRKRPEDPGAGASTVAEALDELESRFDRSMAVLDWNTNLDLARRFPAHTIFSPPADGNVLPYLDHSVDVVVVREPNRMVSDEAARVAQVAVVTLEDGRGKAGRGIRSRIEWLDRNARSQTPSASIIVAITSDESASLAQLAAVCGRLPKDIQGEVLVPVQQVSDGLRHALLRMQRDHAVLRQLEGALDDAIRRASGDVLVFVGENALPLPQYLLPLLRSLRRLPNAAAVGGRVVGTDGYVVEAGGCVSDDGIMERVGEGHPYPDDPTLNFVREVDFCSRSILATWHSVFDELGGFDMAYHASELQDADYCLRVRRKGGSVYYVPESSVVRLDGLTRRVADEHDVALFAERWTSSQPAR
jgi:hypothetical protein